MGSAQNGGVILKYLQTRNENLLSNVISPYSNRSIPNAITLHAGIKMVCSNRPSEIHYKNGRIERTTFRTLMAIRRPVNAFK